MRRYRVGIQTVVLMELTVEADSREAAVVAAATRARPAEYFAGNDLADEDEVSVMWDGEHASAWVVRDDAGGGGGAVPTVFIAEEAGWRRQ